MKLWILRLLSTFMLFGAVGVGFLGSVAFAEDDGICKGKISGVTTIDADDNMNAGQINFDSHGGPENMAGLPPELQAIYEKDADLSILGLAEGLAPESRAAAACVKEGGGTDFEWGDYEYVLDRYAWNDNVGFIMFNPIVEATNYGVKVGPEDGGVRELFGYAWNPVLGYLQFRNGNDPYIQNSVDTQVWPDWPTLVEVGGVSYQVEVVNVFFLDGEWQAVIWVNGNQGVVPLNGSLNFGPAVDNVVVSVSEVKAGAEMYAVVSLSKEALPIEYGVTLDAAGNLNGYAWSDAGVWVPFNGVKMQLPGEDNVVDQVPGGHCAQVPKPGACVDVDSGDDGYKINLYLREEDGVTPLDLDMWGVNLVFEWEDTIKLNQLAFSSVGSDLNQKAEPFAEGLGGVIHKPLAINDAMGAGVFEPAVDPGHYVYSQEIKSVAPSSNANFSMTTSTQPPLQFFNEKFVSQLGEWSNQVEENNLILNDIKYDLYLKGQMIVAPPVVNPVIDWSVAHPNGIATGYNFVFDPIVKVDQLNTGNDDDAIVGFRNIPVSFGIKASKGVAPASAVIGAEKVAFVLDYSQEETENPDVNTLCDDADPELKSFDYEFVNDDGAPLSGEMVPVEEGYSQVDFDQAGSNVQVFTLEALTNQILNAVATLPDFNPDEPGDQLPCDIVKGPTLYSVVTYNATVGGVSYPVSYYSNKLPRLSSAIYNPAAVVHGNVYAPKAFSPTAAYKTQTTGNIAIDIVRNTVNENIKKFLGSTTVSSGEECSISKLLDAAPYVRVTCPTGSYAVKDYVNGDKTEHVIYFNGRDVHLKLDKGLNSDDSLLQGDWVLIVEDGGVYIDSDVYHENMDDGRLSIVSMSSYGNDCADSNIYLHTEVTNVDANIISDCSLFAYHPEVGVDVSTGFPNWEEGDMMYYAKYQKLFRGSLATRNTIGGADLDADGQEYLLLGTGEIYELPATPKERLEAQMYDLNYLALFRLGVEIADNGYPMDQKCKMALSIEKMLQIKQYDEAVGGGGPVVNSVNGLTCDGIDLIPYDPVTNEGDLVADFQDDTSVLAEGLNNQEGGKDFEPVYIFYNPPDSFVFKKSAGVTTQ